VDLYIHSLISLHGVLKLVKHNNNFALQGGRYVTKEIGDIL
jgi:hypothetical protein